MHRAFIAVVGFVVCAASGAGQEAGTRPLEARLDGQSQHLLRHLFHTGSKRRYRCRSVTSMAHGKIRATDPEVAERMTVLNSKPQSQLVEFVEEEACLATHANDAADVSYRSISCRATSSVGDEEVYCYEIDGPDALRELGWEPSVIGLASFFEPVHYTIDRDMRILAVRLPSSLDAGRLGRSRRESYRRALESRYRTFFPDHPVGPGDTWDGSIPLAEGMGDTAGMMSGLDYRVAIRHLGYGVKSGRDCAVLDLEITLDQEPGGMLRRGSHLELELVSFKGTSRVWFAVREGHPVLEDSRLELKAVQHIKQGRQVTMSLPLHGTQQILTAWVPPPAKDTARH